MDGEQDSTPEITAAETENSDTATVETGNEDKWRDVPNDVILNHPVYKGLQRELSRKDTELKKSKGEFSDLKGEVIDIKEMLLHLTKAEAETFSEETATALRKRASDIETSANQRRQLTRHETARAEAAASISESIDDAGLKDSDPIFEDAKRVWAEADRTGDYAKAERAVYKAIREHEKSQRDSAVKEAQKKASEESKTKKLASVDTSGPSARTNKKYTAEEVLSLPTAEYLKLPEEIRRAALEGRL